MSSTCVSLLAALSFCVAPGARGEEKKRPVTVADLMKVRNVVDLAIAPDGKAVVYVVSVPDMKEGRYNPDLWLRRFGRGEKEVQLTNGPKRDDKPAWSPDGTTVAFLSDREGKKAQVWLISPTGGEARKLSDLPGGVVELAWSPDGKQIAVIAAEPETKEEKQRKEDKVDVVVVEKDDKANQLHVVDTATGKARQLTRGAKQVQNMAWSPDGQTIACGVQRSPRLADMMEVDLVAVNVADGKTRGLVRRPGIDTAPRYSPDGKQIAFVSHDGKADWIANTSLCVVPAEGGKARNVSKGLDEMVPWWDPQGIHWSADGKSLHFAAAKKLENHLYSIDVASGSVKQLTNGGVADRLRVSKDGSRVTYLAEGPSSPADVVMANWPPGGGSRLRTNPHLSKVQLGQMEAVTWKGKDGQALDGVLILPPGRKDNERVPLLTYVHGGPQGRFALSFSPQRWGTVQAEPYPVHVLAGKGFAVFCPNPRGSGGYGRKFRRANVKDWGFGDFDDIQSGIDALIERGVADKERLGIMGWSYGGYMTGWAITRTGRFKAASAGAGVFNLTSMYGTTDIQPFMERYFGGTPWEARAAYEKHSSIYRADKVTTPTLIQHGDRDLRVPLSQSQELFRALKRNKVPVEMVVYPRQAHILGEPALQQDAMRRNVEWFEKWLLKGGARGKK